MRKNLSQLAALVALAGTAGFAPAPALGQPAQDPGEIRWLRDGFETGQSGASEAGNQSRNGGKQGLADGAIVTELPDPLRDLLRDPLRDPLLAAEQEAAPVARRNPAANNTAQSADDPTAALGVRMGSFLLFPELSVERVYDDNPFLSTSNPQGDWALVLKPSLQVRSGWSRHSLTATLSGERSYHERFLDENAQSTSASAAGRLDIRRDTNLAAGASYSQFLEDRSSTDFPAGASERTTMRRKTVSLEGNHGFNRISLTLRGELFEEDFDDGAAIGGGSINNDDRDFVERRVTGRAAYEFMPGVAVFAEASVNQRVFAEAFDDDGTRNGSSGYNMQAGVSFKLTGKLTGEFSAGYTSQTPDDVTLLVIDGLILNAGLAWQATGLTTVRLDAASSVEETTQAGSAGSILRSVAVTVEHRPRRHILLGASLGYEREEFSGGDSVDEDIRLGLTGEYNFTRSAALIAAYSYHDSISSTPDSGYAVNKLRLGVRLRR